MSGFCDFCQAWHSAGCCHPGRSILAEREAQTTQLKARVETLETVCAEAYQLAGACGAPAKVLDNLSDAAQGRPIRHITFLPISPDDLAEVRILKFDLKEAQKRVIKLEKEELFNLGV